MVLRERPAEGDDGWLLRRARDDPEAFAAFYERNVDAVLAWFHRRTGNAAVSGDLTAETFAQAFRWRRRFDPARGSSGRAWLFGIAANLHRDWVRRAAVDDRARRKLGITTPTVTDDDLERILDRVDLAAQHDELRAGLDRLTPRVRHAVVLRVALDLPYVTVAERLGCSVGAARERVSRGLAALRAIR